MTLTVSTSDSRATKSKPVGNYFGISLIKVIWLESRGTPLSFETKKPGCFTVIKI